jgi:hypothetical protein
MAKITAEDFNKKFPVGTAVRYHPIIDHEGYVESKTRSKAWELGHGEPVVMIEGKAGGVSLDAIATICPRCDEAVNLGWLHGCD